MTAASLDLSPRPELVRIARMMSVSLARRSGLPDPLLDEVRVAVGEAVSRAVQINAHRDGAEPVRCVFTEDDRGYEVAVTDAGAVESVPDVADVADSLPDLSAEDVDSGGVPPGLDLALVAGMADEVQVAADPAGGTVVRLRWTR